MSYCIDTSALLDGWVRYYPPDVFPALWEQFAALIAAEEFFAPDEVLAELEQKDDDVYAWAKKHSEMFVPLSEEVQRTTTTILTTFPGSSGQ